MALKMSFTDPPAAVMATTATNEMSPTSNAYSMRSCPSSFRRSACARVIRFILLTFLRKPLRRRRGCQLRLDRLEDVVDRSARGGDGDDRDQRDEPHEQRVLDEVLRLVLTRERTQTLDEIHDIPPARSLRRRAWPCVRNAITRVGMTAMTGGEIATAVPQHRRAGCDERASRTAVGQLADRARGHRSGGVTVVSYAALGTFVTADRKFVRLPVSRND